jgi:hypothetical protein
MSATMTGEKHLYSGEEWQKKVGKNYRPVSYEIFILPMKLEPAVFSMEIARTMERFSDADWIALALRS